MGRLWLIPLSACLFSMLLLAEVTSATLMKMSTIPIFPTIPRDRTNEDFQVLLRVEAPSAVDSHVPIDVVAVLDVSGSMNSPAGLLKKNQASRLDVLKTAMKFVIRKLYNEDRLSIVAFNDGPVKEYSAGFLDMSGDGRSIAEKNVDKLEAYGGTALMSGLEEAIKILDERSDNSRLGFIVLLTDGDNKNGYRWSRDAIRGAVSKYPVHTFGLCTAHDPEPLHYIAQESRGTYSFVDDENLDKITTALALCVGGLNSVVDVGTRVILKAANGVKIVKIYSGGYASSVQEDKTSAEVTIGALYAGEVKNFIFHLYVPLDAEPAAGDGLCCNQRELLIASLESLFIDAASPIRDVLIVERPPTAVLPKVPSSMVVNHIFRFKVLEMVDIFIKNEILQFTSVGDLGTKLLVEWEKLVQVHQFWVGLDLEGVHSEIHAVANTLQTQGITGGVRPSSMAAYIFSWMSSYQMQRPTAMGSPDKVVGTFVTLEVHLTLQAAITFPSGDIGCPQLPPADFKCEYSCVEQLPPAKPLLVPSGHGDNSFHFNPDYKGIVSLEDIVKFMSKIYEGMVIANNLKQCSSSSAVA